MGVGSGWPTAEAESPVARAASAPSLDYEIIAKQQSRGHSIIHVRLKPPSQVFPDVTVLSRIVQEVAPGDDDVVMFYLPSMSARSPAWAVVTKHDGQAKDVRTYPERAPRGWATR